MDAKFTVADDSIKLVHPHLATIVILQRTTSDESALVNCEDERVEKLPISSVKRDVKEDAFCVFRHSVAELKCYFFLAAAFLGLLFLTEYLVAFFATSPFLATAFFFATPEPK